MKQFQVVHPHDLELPLTIEADQARQDWLGTLRFYRGPLCVAEFVRRSWASWWEVEARVLPEKQGENQPKPYGGPLTPVDRPSGWMRS